MTKILFFLLLISTSLFANNEDITNADTPVLSTETPEVTRKINHRASHWLTTLGFEGMKYEVPFQEFRGARKNFGPTDQELWGGRFGFGKEFHLGGNLMTTTKAEIYYVGTLFSRTLNGGPQDSSIKFAYTKKTGQLYGIDAVQSLSWLFDFKTTNPFLGDVSYLVFEPFIEAGVGYGSALNRINYQYDTGTDPTAARESYRLAIEDTLVNTRIGGGFNITSGDGAFFYMRAHVNRFDAIKREGVGFSQPNGAAKTFIKTSESNVTIDPIVTFALGGGYKF